MRDRQREGEGAERTTQCCIAVAEPTNVSSLRSRGPVLL